MHTEEDRLSNAIIGCALEVHQGLGPGLLESAYETCLCYEMTQRGIAFERQKEQPVKYKQVELDAGYRLDLVVGGLVVVELKSVAQLEPIHEAQMLTHLKLSGLKLGLLMNFNVPVLKSGIKRMVNGL